MLRQKLRHAGRVIGRILDMPLELRGTRDELLDVFASLHREVMGTLAAVKQLETRVDALGEPTGYSTCSWWGPESGSALAGALCLGAVFRTKADAEAYAASVPDITYTIVPVYFPIPWEKVPIKEKRE